MKWVSNGKEDPDWIIHLKSINVVRGYIQVPGVDYIESFSPVATDISIIIMVVLTLYQEEGVLVYKICDIE